MTLLPFLRDLRVLRQWTGVCDMSPDYSPIMSATPVEDFYITTGWGTWGFKAIPAGGEQMAGLVATGEPPSSSPPSRSTASPRSHPRRPRLRRHPLTLIRSP